MDPCNVLRFRFNLILLVVHIFFTNMFKFINFSCDIFNALNKTYAVI